MIEIIKEEVKMPPPSERLFQYNISGKKWVVINTELNSVIYKGSYEDAAIRSHNLNKKYYRDTQPLTK